MLLKIDPQRIYPFEVLAVLDGQPKLFKLFLELPAMEFDILPDASTSNPVASFPKITLEATLIQVKEYPKVD